ncbi:MerR family transcriptional regulator [Sporolactobacillus sp. THM7-7]|nr:MerR family transcriptional regulator [Sporolactobacillus sp. THM7-7]
MQYTVKQLSDLAGVSARTLRFYDQTGLLKPEKINTSGYRIYGTRQVDRLQQILFYRELGLSLKTIQAILDAPDFNVIHALSDHHKKLSEKRRQLDRLIATVEKTLAAKKGEKIMNDTEKFEGFKQELIDKNEALYGKEIREKYGDEAVRQSNEKWKKMSQADYDASSRLEEALSTELKRALKTGDPAGQAAQKAAELHRQWLSYFWVSYSKEAHAGLGNLYTADTRFTDYYDSRIGKGAAKLLRDAILIYTKTK